MSGALERHLAAWFGAWAPAVDGLAVVAADRRVEPTWDGAVRPLIGAVRPDGTGTVVVAPRLADEVGALIDRRRAAQLGGDDRRRIGEVVHGAGATLGIGVLRWIARGEDDVADEVEQLGTWIAHDDPRVPDWLHPFGGDALVALDEEGAYAAGVGVKRHDPTGHELSVVTDPRHRGKGLATRLVATATRAQLDHVPVVTYLHARDNTGSARVADTVGFQDRGWGIIGVFGGEAPG